jgi:hypothetical protein
VRDRDVGISGRERKYSTSCTHSAEDQRRV